MANIVVVGAGVIGATSAFMLARAGHVVTLIDRNAAPCLGASQRNGAQLSYAYCDALGSPGLLRHLPGILLGLDPAYRVKLQLDPEFLLWGMKFLANSTEGRFLRNTGALLEMAAATKRLLSELIATYDLTFDYRVAGKMMLVPADDGMEKQRKLITWKRQRGIDQALLSRNEAEQIEPSIGLYRDRIAAVVYNPADAVGSPTQFCNQLISIARSQMGLRTRFGVTVKRIMTHRGQAHAVQLDKEEPVLCDAVIVSTGIASSLTSKVGPGYGKVWPVQGYSISVPAPVGLFDTSVTDTSRKLVFARLGQELRIAGIADIGGRDLCFQEERCAALVRGATEAFDLPPSPKPQTLSPWSGARPCTPSSVPVVATTTTTGVYANYGHGTLGWTLCLGAAEKLLQLVDRAS